MTALAPRSARTSDGLVVAFRALDAAAPCAQAWDTLSRHALVENVFFEPGFALAAAEAFGEGIGVLMVCDRAPEDQGVRLLALWPCRVVRRWGLPMPALMGWTHGFSIFGAPLIDAGDPVRALDALLDAPRHLGLPRRLLMPYLPVDGPFAALLEQARARRGMRRADYWMHDRGFLDLTGLDPAARRNYLVNRLSAKKRQQLDRLFRRLEARGPVTYETLRTPGVLAQALDDYIALETRGWKGRAGTAIGGAPREVGFLHALVRAYGPEGRIRIDRLRRDGQSLAASIGLETNSTLWYLKISHAEDEAKNSPGAQLIRRVTDTLLAEARFTAADSCAPPDFSLIRTFWGDRRHLTHTLIEAGGGDRYFRLAMLLERARFTAGRLRGG